MRVGKKLFPYPVLNNQNTITSFKESIYSLEYIEEENDNYLIFKDLHICLSNTTLNELLKNKKAKAVMIVECSQTLFRQTYEVSLDKIDIKISFTELRGIVDISSFIYATEDIHKYIDNDFLDFYKGYTFEIEKYNILAADDGYTMKVDYDPNDDKKVASIFKIIKSEDESITQMKVIPNDRMIIIYLPTDQFQIYDSLKKNGYYQNIFFAIIAIPSLSYSLQELKNNYSDIEEMLMDNSWFNSVKIAYENLYNITLTSEVFEQINTLEVSQNLLNSASIKAIEDIFNMPMNINLGDDEDE